MTFSLCGRRQHHAADDLAGAQIVEGFVHILERFFAKNRETGAFYAGALFGFKPDEDLLGGPEDAPPPYIPLDQQRAGFYVSGEDIAIDLDHPRFASSGSEGEALFDDDGQPGPSLRQIQRMLGQLVRGKQET